MSLTDLTAALPVLIFTYWTLAAGSAIIALIPLPFANGFRSAVLLSACRGKLMDSKPANALGPLSDWTVPQHWFWHFYALGAIWTVGTAWLFFTASFSSFTTSIQATSQASLLLLEFHLVRRLLETLALLKYPPHAKMHGIAYLFGISYYLLVPLTLLPQKSIIDMANFVIKSTPAMRAKRLNLLPWDQLTPGLDPMQLLGVAVVLLGNFLQFHSHLVLARMSSRTGRYKIPKGGAFDLVSCPHYLGEMVIYSGLLMVNGGKERSAWMMLIWVVSNLLLAGGMTHAWYTQRFKTYPKSRRAIIPYVY